MNPIKLIIAVLFLFLCTIPAIAQNVKPEFKKFMYVVYRPNDSLRKLRFTIEYYIEINNNGTAHFVLNEYNGLSYIGLMKDSTYIVPDTVMIALNKIFNGRRRLDTHVTLDKHRNDSGFSGPLRYIAYSTKNNTVDHLILSGLVLDDDLLYVLNKLHNWMPFVRTSQKRKVYHDKLIEEEIITYHKACHHIPKISSPPSLKILGNVVKS